MGKQNGILLNLPENLLEKIDFIAEQEGRSRSATIREMLYWQLPHALNHAELTKKKKEAALNGKIYQETPQNQTESLDMENINLLGKTTPWDKE